MKLIPKDEFYGQDTKGKGFFKLIPKEEFYAPKPYPTEPSLFGLTPGMQLPAEPEPYPEFEIGAPPETIPPVAPALPEAPKQPLRQKAGPLAWHLIPEDQRMGDIDETIKNLEPRKSDPFPRPIVEAIHELHNQGLPIDQIDKVLVDKISKGELPTWEMHISDKPEIEEAPPYAGPGPPEAIEPMAPLPPETPEAGLLPKATGFVASVGRAAARKLIPPALDMELDSKRELAKGLYLGGDPIPQEDLVDHFVNPEKYDLPWTPMSPDEAKQFVEDQQNLELVENLAWIAIIGHGVYRGIRSIPAVYRAMKEDFSRILWEEVPREAQSIAQRLESAKKMGLNRARWEDITAGRGKPPTDKEKEIIEKSSHLRKVKGFRAFFKKWFGVEKPEEPVAIKGLPEPAEARIPPEPTVEPKPPTARVPAVKEPPVARTMAELRAIAEKEFPKPRKVEEFPAKPAEVAPEVKPREEIRAEPKVEVPGKWEELVPQSNIRDIIENNKSYSFKDFKPIFREFEIVGVSPDKVDIKYKNIALGEFPSKYATGEKRNKAGLIKSALDKLYAEVTAKPPEPAKPPTLEEAARAKAEAEMPEVLEEAREREKPPKLPKRPMAKDAWKLTLDQYIAKYGKKGQDPGIQRAFFGLNHKKIIQQALSEGKPVPPEVLADYPELKPPEIKKEPWEMGAEAVDQMLFKTWEIPGALEPRPPRKGVTVKAFPRYDELVKEIQAAIKKAPEDSPPADKPMVQFKTDGKASIYNTKQALKTYLKNVEKKKQFRARLGEIEKAKPKAKIIPKPSAARNEEIGELVPMERKGWFTDGHLLVKGEPPAKAKFIERDILITDESFKNVIPEKKDQTTAELVYYTLVTEELKAASRNPLASDRDEIPLAIFKTKDVFVSFNQRKLMVIKNRYPKATYRIGEDTLVAYDKGEMVGLLKAMSPTEEITGFATKLPPGWKEAREAGLIEETEAMRKAEAEEIAAKEAEKKKVEEAEVAPKEPEEKPPEPLAEVAPSKGPSEKSYGYASVGTYATGTEQYAAPLKAVIDLPEIVEMAKQLGKGFFPKIVRKIRAAGGLAQGAFAPKGLGRIEVRADVFKDVDQARAVLAHEVGHWIDYLPQRFMTRGNILGRIGSLKKYMKRTLPRKPGTKEELTEADRRRLRYQAQKLIAHEYKDKWIDEEITRELPISPDEVLAIWNTVEDALKANPELYRFVQTLNTAEKKAIVKTALKGAVELRLKNFVKKIKEKTGKKIKVEPSKELIAKKYQELIKKEIEKLRLFKADEIMDELKTVSRTWKPFDPAANPVYTKYRYKSVELYADAISALFNAPGLLRSMAPNFYEGFFNYLEAKPEIKKLYEGIQDDITAGRTDQNLTKRTYEGFRRGDDAYALGLQRKYRYFDAMMRELVDAHWMVIKKVRKVGDRKIDPSKNPRYKLEEMVYTGSEVEWMLGQTVHNVIRPLEDVGLDWDNFGLYRLLKRVSSERAEVANPLGWHKGRALEKIKALERDEWKGERWEAVQKADKAFNEIREHLLDKAEKAGRYDPEFLEIMRGNVGDYVTFDVAHYIEKRHGAAPLAKIFPQIGTFQEVANPATATLLKDIVILKAVNRQIAAESVTKFLQEHYPKEIRPADTKWNGRFHAIQDPPRGEDLGLIVYLKDGKPTGHYVDRWVADIFERSPIEGMAIANILRLTAKPFRMVFTEMNPGFWLFNIHRDYFRAAQMLPKAKITSFAKYYAKSIVPALKSVYGIPTEVVDEMLKGNMLISIEGVRGLSPQDKEIERLIARYRMAPPKVWQKKILKPFGDLFNLYTNIGRAIERMPKIGGYTYLKKRFPDMPSELIGHIVRTRAGSPDFLRLGRAYPIYNNLLLFSNAIKEGYRGDYEAMADNPAEFWYKKGKYIFLPKMLMYAASIGLLGAGIKKVYDGVTDYDMANYLVVPLGLTPNGSSVYLRIPTDEGSRLLGGVLIKGLQRDRPKHLNYLIDYMAGQAPTINPAIENLVSVVQYLAGHNPYDNFRGRYAIPESIFRAYDERSHKAFIRWLANRSGSTIVYRFRSNDIEQVNEELREVLNYPFVSNIVGRFIKVHQAGIREKIKIERELVKRENAKKILDAKEVLAKIINGELLTREEILTMASKPDVLERNFVKGIARKYGSVLAEEVWSVFQTGTTEEKVRVLQKIVELDAMGRTGKEYRWLWQKELRK